MPFESTVQTHAHSTSCDLSSMTSPNARAFSPFSPSTKGFFPNLHNIHRPWRSNKATAQDVIARIVAKDQALANAYTQPTPCSNAAGSAKTVTTTGGRSPLRQVPERFDSYRALTSSRSVQTAGSNSAPTTATTASAITSKPVCAAGAARANATTTASNGTASASAKVTVTSTAPASVVASASVSASTFAPAKSTNAGPYFNKSLPPTPRRSSPLNPNFKANNAEFANVPTNVSMIFNNGNSFDLSMVMDTVKPLDIETCRRTLAAKRLSRSAHCNRSMPAPIFLPPLPVLAPQAVQGESPQVQRQAQAQAKESKHAHSRSTSTARVNQTTSMLLEEIRIHDHETSSMEITPIDVTPLDIPVDWDDLRDRWTSPVEKTAAIPFVNMSDMVNMAEIANLTRMPKFAMSVDLYDDDATTNEPARDESAKVDAADVFSAFQQDVTRLFALSPTLNAKGFSETASIEISISSGSSASGDDASISEHDHPLSVDEVEDFDVQSVVMNISDLYCDFPEPPPLTAQVSRNVKRHARFVSLEDLDLDDLVSPVTRRLSHQIQLERGLERQISMSASVEDELVTIEGSELVEEAESTTKATDLLSDSQVRRDSCVLPRPPSSPRNLCSGAGAVNVTLCEDLDNSNPSKLSPKIKALGRLITDSAIDSHRAVPKLAPSGNRHGARAQEVEPKKGESFLSMFSPLSPLQTGTLDIEFD